MLPRYWGAYEGANVRGGSLSQNGCGHFADFDDASLDYIKSLGCSHIWYTGVIRHSTCCTERGCRPSHPQFVKGAAGSPYAISDYYDVNPYLATDPSRRMEEFASLVERTHSKGLKVILDFVPNHVSRDNVNFGLDDDKSVHWSPSNDFFYYPGAALNLPTEFVPTAEFPEPYAECPARASGNDCYRATPDINDWYETVKLNYCSFHTPTWDKALDILRFWASKGVDGFRCDMVELVPPEFFRWAIAVLKSEFPGLVFIAEVYDMSCYEFYSREVGFDLLYDKSGLYDTLRRIVSGQGSCREITSLWQRLGPLQGRMLNFLENHDEQRVASRFFAGKADGAFAALAVSLLFMKAPFMLYFCEEVGEEAAFSEGFSGCDGRTSIFDWWAIPSQRWLQGQIHGCCGSEDSSRAAILEKYREILRLRALPAFSEGENYDLCYCNETSEGFNPDRHFAFLRYLGEERYLVCCNFDSASPAEMSIFIPPLEKSVRLSVEPCSYNVVKL